MSPINYVKPKAQRKEERHNAMLKARSVEKDNLPQVDIFKWGSWLWGHDHFKYYTVILPYPLTEEDILRMVREGYRAIQDD